MLYHLVSLEDDILVVELPRMIEYVNKVPIVDDQRNLFERILNINTYKIEKLDHDIIRQVMTTMKVRAANGLTIPFFSEPNHLWIRDKFDFTAGEYEFFGVFPIDVAYDVYECSVDWYRGPALIIETREDSSNVRIRG